MNRAMPWNEQIDITSLDDSSSSDSEIEVNDVWDCKQPVNDGCDGKQPVDDGCNGKQPINNPTLNQSVKEITSEGICQWGFGAWLVYLLSIDVIGKCYCLGSFLMYFSEICIQLKLVCL